jgi:hypothetical protein
MTGGIATHGRPGKTQTIAYTATPATSQAIGPQTYRVRLVATTAALVNLGDAASMYLAPNFPEVFIVTPGQSLTVVEVSAAGNLCLTELE